MGTTIRSTLAMIATLALALPAGARIGGPDAYGYSFTDSTELDGPAYGWEDLSVMGFEVSLSNDEVAMVDLYFDFWFYGQRYDQVGIQANGSLSFSADGLTNYNECLPWTGAPQTLIAAYWDYLYPAIQGTIRYLTTGSAPYRVFIAEWADIYNISGAGNADFQIVLYETTNEIEFHYMDVSSPYNPYNYGGQATVGIQGNLDEYLQYSCNEQALADGLAIRFSTCLAGSADGDGDGFEECHDCDDTDAAVYPGAEDICDDGIDSDCRGDLGETEVDDDGDGFSECGGDCDDEAATTFPGAMEACNGIDDNCDGAIDEDMDGDGWSLCAGDCDDTDPERSPSLTEECDGKDNDCDDEVDEEIDWDLDGYFGCGGEDCDDGNATAYPGATEVPGNGVDEDCDGADTPGDDDDDDDVPGDDDSADEDEGGCECRSGTGREAAPAAVGMLALALILLRRRG